MPKSAQLSRSVWLSRMVPVRLKLCVMYSPACQRRWSGLAFSRLIMSRSDVSAQLCLWCLEVLLVPAFSSGSLLRVRQTVTVLSAAMVWTSTTELFASRNRSGRLLSMQVSEYMDPQRRFAEHVAYPPQRMIADIARYKPKNYHFYYEILKRNNSKVESITSEAHFIAHYQTRGPEGYNTLNGDPPSVAPILVFENCLVCRSTLEMFFFRISQRNGSCLVCIRQRLLTFSVADVSCPWPNGALGPWTCWTAPLTGSPPSQAAVPRKCNVQ